MPKFGNSMKATSAMACPKSIPSTHLRRAVLCQKALPLLSRWATANSTQEMPRITLESAEGGVLTSS